jgi:hypothetical protein
MRILTICVSIALSPAVFGMIFVPHVSSHLRVNHGTTPLLGSVIWVVVIPLPLVLLFCCFLFTFLFLVGFCPFIFFYFFGYIITLSKKKWAIAQENEPRWSKHVLRQFHLIRKTIEMKNIKIVRVNIEENLINPVTKTLSSI